MANPPSPTTYPPSAIAAAAAHLHLKRQVREKEGRYIPKAFLDPLTGEVMTDPVILPSSGKTVDRQTMYKHMREHGPWDPFTGVVYGPERGFMGVQGLRGRIEGWKDQGGPDRDDWEEEEMDAEETVGWESPPIRIERIEKGRKRKERDDEAHEEEMPAKKQKLVTTLEEQKGDLELQEELEVMRKELEDMKVETKTYRQRAETAEQKRDKYKKMLDQALQQLKNVEILRALRQRVEAELAKRKATEESMKNANLALKTLKKMSMLP